jgi:hypothetical protein
MLTGVGGIVPGLPIAGRMGDLERTRVTSAHSSLGRRIVLLRRETPGLALERRQPVGRDERTRDGYPHAIDEVTSTDIAVHPKITISTL